MIKRILIGFVIFLVAALCSAVILTSLIGGGMLIYLGCCMFGMARLCLWVLGLVFIGLGVYGLYLLGSIWQESAEYYIEL